MDVSEFALGVEYNVPWEFIEEHFNRFMTLDAWHKLFHEWKMDAND